MLILSITISCNETNVRKIEKEKKNYPNTAKKSNEFKNKSLELEIIDFINKNPKQYENIETYYISFCTKDLDTVITLQKGLYSETFAFINQDIEYKGWLEYNGNFINIVDRKLNPIGKDMFDYKLLSKDTINNKKVIEYHGQKRLHQLIVDKQFILKDGILKVINDKKRICVFH